MKKLSTLAAILSALFIASFHAQAQPYPSKPIRAVVAFGTGGATDVIARLIAASLSQSLGQLTLQKPEVLQQIERQAMDVRFLAADAVSTLAREQTQVWRTLTKAAGMAAE